MRFESSVITRTRTFESCGLITTSIAERVKENDCLVFVIKLTCSSGIRKKSNRKNDWRYSYILGFALKLNWIPLLYLAFSLIISSLFFLVLRKSQNNTLCTIVSFNSEINGYLMISSLNNILSLSRACSAVLSATLWQIF